VATEEWEVSIEFLRRVATIEWEVSNAMTMKRSWKV